MNAKPEFKIKEIIDWGLDSEETKDEYTLNGSKKDFDALLESKGMEWHDSDRNSDGEVEIIFANDDMSECLIVKHDWFSL